MNKTLGPSYPHLLSHAAEGPGTLGNLVYSQSKWAIAKITLAILISLLHSPLPSAH